MSGTRTFHREVERLAEEYGFRVESRGYTSKAHLKLTLRAPAGWRYILTASCSASDGNAYKQVARELRRALAARGGKTPCHG